MLVLQGDSESMISPTPLNRRTPAELAREFPLLYELSANLGLAIPPVYTKSHLKSLFGCTEKTIRRWTNLGLLPNRRLPNRGRCLPSDLEEFLRRT